MKTLLQVVPHRPGSRQGVADYALNVALQLREREGIESIYAIPSLEGPELVENFKVIPFEQAHATSADAVLLHYVNYGFHPRGIPRWLPAALQRLLDALNGPPLVTIFHELYASGRPWESAFWLQPLQKSIARHVARLSRTCVISNPIAAADLARLAPQADIVAHPIPSTFGESELEMEDLEKRDPHCWVLCGSPPLLCRSLKSFIAGRHHVPIEYAPRHVIIFGGRDDPEISLQRKLLEEASVEYREEVGPEEAAGLLRQAAFGWLDYFPSPPARAEVLWKSSVFAAMCAHGVLPVFPCALSQHVADRRLPDASFVAEQGSYLPRGHDRILQALAFHQWYRSNATLNHTVATLMKALT